MSRIAKKPVNLPKGVEFKSADGQFTIKGPKGALSIPQPQGIDVSVEQGALTMVPASPDRVAMAGTLRTLLSNMAIGVSEGFERKLELVGVGYRAAMNGKDLSLSLGFSHPVVFTAPEGITLEVPTQTEVRVKGADKQQVGEIAAKIRAVRPPEPYKGKGVRIVGERVRRKEGKTVA